MIEALKQALEAFEDISSWYDYEQSVGELASNMYEASCLAKSKANELRQAIAELESQEPVAWMSPNKERLQFSRKDTVYGSHTIPLYTHPPQRTWVGLDHHDKKKFSSWLDHKSDDEVFTAIEGKLKQKNGFAEELNT